MLDLIQQWTQYLANAPTLGGWIIAAVIVVITFSTWRTARDPEPDPMSSPWGDVIDTSYAVRLRGASEADGDFCHPIAERFSHDGEVTTS